MTLEEISTEENSLVTEARALYGEYFEHAQYSIDFLHSFLKTVSPEAAFFAMFLASVEKHVIIGILSGVGLHHVQSILDLRYATESGCWAAYALAHPDTAKFVSTSPSGYIKPTKELKGAMYKWIEDNYPAGNDSIKRYKDQLNALSSHANLVDSQRNFGEMSETGITTSFFDNSEEHHVKTDLWAAANLVMGLLDLFYGVSKDFPIITFTDDFLTRMKILKIENDRLKSEMMNHPRIKAHAPK